MPEAPQRGNMRFERITVACREEYRAQQEPIAFFWRGMEIHIRAILDRWYEGHLSRQRVPQRYYRVLTEDGRRFVIRYNELFDAWGLLLPEDQEPAPPQDDPS
ncbi:MAG TPA: hypothetical protein DCE18_14450 [Syntrophobacteraceae bacterium]|nr:hypothetical protein [Syntrophobacteraceae bacterium]